MQIVNKQGSATSARPEAKTDHLPERGIIIAHLCNHVGAWGAGFVLAVNEVSLAPKLAYQGLAKKHNGSIPMGTTQFVETDPDLWFSNMIAQNGVKKTVSTCLVDYKALQKCLELTFRRAVLLRCNVHIPDGIGSGLAGGDKAVIMALIEETAKCVTVQSLETRMGFIPILTLWEFVDTTAASYVAPQVTTKVTPETGLPNDDDLVFDLEID